MSKFNNTVISSNGNIVGDDGVINNTTINNTAINNNHQNSTNENSTSEVFGLGIGLIFGLGVIVLQFFKNVDQIYEYLIIAAITSSILAVFALLILIFSKSVEWEDSIRTFVTIIFSISLLGLSVVAESLVSNKIKALSQKADIFHFWKTLTEHDEKVAIINISIACLIMIAITLNHLISIRQFSYSLAKKNRKGLWHSLYKLFGVFKIKYAGTLLLSIIGGIFFLLGKLMMHW